MEDAHRFIAKRAVKICIATAMNNIILPNCHLSVFLVFFFLLNDSVYCTDIAVRKIILPARVYIQMRRMSGLESVNHSGRLYVERKQQPQWFARKNVIVSTFQELASA